MIGYTLLNVLMVELKIYCGPDKFYGPSKFGQYDGVKNRAPFTDDGQRTVKDAECSY